MMSRTATFEEIKSYAERNRFCICLDLSIIPLLSNARIRPSEHCPLHKTLAVRWSKIKSWDDFNAALNADKIPGEPLSNLPDEALL